jgi:hypothetical protein
MSDGQLALLCFWPVIAIGWPFFLWLSHERMQRFSLRTMLIASTLLGVMLGLIVYTTRQ